MLQPMAAQQLVAQPVLLSSHGSTLDNFGENQDHSQIFTAQRDRFMAGRPIAFPSDFCTEKEATAKQTIIFIEGNDSELDNYHDFMCKFKGYFGDSMQTIMTEHVFQTLNYLLTMWDGIT